MIDIVIICNTVFFTIFGILFGVLGKNAQSRILGLVAFTLAIANGLKLVGLI